MHEVLLSRVIRTRDTLCFAALPPAPPPPLPESLALKCEGCLKWKYLYGSKMPEGHH